MCKVKRKLATKLDELLIDEVGGIPVKEYWHKLVTCDGVGCEEKAELLLNLLQTNEF